MLPYTCASHPAQQDTGYPKGKAHYSQTLHAEETPKFPPKSSGCLHSGSQESETRM